MGREPNSAEPGERLMLRRWAVTGLLLGLVGCGATGVDEKVTAPPPPPPPPPTDYAKALPPGQYALRKITDPKEIPDFGEAWGWRDGLLDAVRRSISYLGDRPSSKGFFPSNGISHERNLASLKAFADLLQTCRDPREFDAKVRSQFDVYQSVGCDDRGTVLFTGYYTPILEASTAPSSEYRWPLYRKPDDLVIDHVGTPQGRRTPDGRMVSYYPRGELEKGNTLRGRELVYLKDRFDAYIVHVQGSALLRMPDGRMMKVGYAGKTDRPYRSIGDALVRDGKIKAEERSLQKIRLHFRNHPEDLDKYLPLNENFVFFTESKDGPNGSLNVPVTPLRTLATDKSLFPRAAVCFVSTQIPGKGGIGKVPYKTLMVDQDAGGAIRAAGRADIYMGTGQEAGEVAGHTLSEGKLYYVFLKEQLIPPPNLARR